MFLGPLLRILNRGGKNAPPPGGLRHKKSPGRLRLKLGIAFLILCPFAILRPGGGVSGCFGIRPREQAYRLELSFLFQTVYNIPGVISYGLTPRMIRGGG